MKLFKDQNRGVVDTEIFDVTVSGVIGCRYEETGFTPPEPVYRPAKQRNQSGRID